MLWRITSMKQVWRIQMTVCVVAVQSVRQPQKFKPSPHPRLSFSQHFPKNTPQWRRLSTPLSPRKKSPALTETARQWTRWEFRSEWCHFCSGCMIITSVSSSNGYFAPAHQCYQPLPVAKSLHLILTPALHWILKDRCYFWTWRWPDNWTSSSFLLTWWPFRFDSLRFRARQIWARGRGTARHLICCDFRRCPWIASILHRFWHLRSLVSCGLAELYLFLDLFSAGSSQRCALIWIRLYAFFFWRIACDWFAYAFKHACWFFCRGY